MLVLKPWLFKSGVWNWGTAVNTEDLSVSISQPTHPIFDSLTLDANNRLQLFQSCNTNAVTAISSWQNISGQIEIASPVSQPSYSTITEFPVGSSVGGTTFTAPLLMLGISEYSTANLTDVGVRLVENAIYYLLGLPMPPTGWNPETQKPESSSTKKFFRNGQLLILHNGVIYDISGRIYNT